ncbi:MAG: trypsin-like peptidase domain-containing protein [Acidobacteriota bacterium]|nr:trypsin-like peptidase domain-containing protein [Acidobacteriota bacterium]
MTDTFIDFSNALADAVERAGHAVVSVLEGGRRGVSGTLWRDSLVVATEHTIRGQQEVTIELPDGRSLPAAVVGRDPGTDIALLRATEPVASAIEFADATRLRVGQFVLAIGRRPNQCVVASHGILSALGGAWRTGHGARIDHSFRLDLLPYTGFSGGPLVDAGGRVIGVNTSGPRRTVLTVPASTVNSVVEQLIAKGRVARGYLGVALQPVNLPPAILAQTGTGIKRGLLVVMVEPGSPAEAAGITIGDVVVALDDKPLANPGDLQLALDPERIGQPARLRLIRGGKPHELTLIVRERAE